MTRQIIETRRRGVFGWVFLLMFWGWNILMAVALLGGLSNTSTTFQSLTSDAERAGHAFGTGLGVMMLMSLWTSGAIILGLIVLLTRGKKVFTELDVGDRK